VSTDDCSPTNSPANSFETNAVHAGLKREAGGPIGVPIYQNVAWDFENLDHGASIFATGEGLSYSRIQNPTLEALETRITALEGAHGAVVTSSGNAATLLALIVLARAGDHIVATSSLFGGTVALLGQVLPNFGITSSLVQNDPEAIRAALRPNTRAILLETIGNPALDVPDFEVITRIAQEARVPVVVDNTWGAVGFLCRPLEWGASIVTHSLTKWAAGHGATLGGAILTGHSLDLGTNPLFTEPDRTGRSLLEQFGNDAFLWRARTLGLSQMGMTLAPQSAWAINQGLETMSLRVQRECASTLEVARWLQTQPGVTWTSYGGLPDHAWHANTTKYLRNGHGAVLTFGVRGGLDGARRFMDTLRLIRRAVNLGDTRTLAAHPWTTTHGRLPEHARTAAGVSPEMIRLTVGLEDPADLERDLAQALEHTLAGLEVADAR
jgi:O-acetylhomoserine (thiol)-lyase